MVVSCLSVLAVTVVADDAAGAAGDWDVYTNGDDYPDLDDPEGYRDPTWRSQPGYEYTEEGFKMIPADISKYAPRAGVQTKQPVDLRQGFYFEVRIDQFDWDASDTWFKLLISTNKYDFKTDDANYKTQGTEVTIRPDKVDGKTSNARLYTVLATPGNSSVVGANFYSTPEQNTTDGAVVYKFTITYNEKDSTYNVNVNGVDVGTTEMAAHSENLEDLDGLAYVGMQAQSNVSGGEGGEAIGMTILKYGKTAADAKVPVGNDKKDPDPNTEEFGARKDIEEVAEGKPAIWMNGSPDSDMGSKYKEVNDDNSIHFKLNGSILWTYPTVKSTTTYYIEDVPYCMVLFRNYCTCDWEDTNGDFVIDSSDAYCLGTETFDMKVSAGTDMQTSKGGVTGNLVPTEQVMIDGDMYTYALADFTSLITTGDYVGRVNNFSINFNKIRTTEAHRCEFDIVGIGMFKSAEDAEAYFQEMMEYYENLAAGEETTEAPGDETTEAPVDETTEAPVDETTEAPVDETTEAPVDETTEAPVDETTEAPADDETTEAPKTTEAPTDGGDDVSVGCGGVVGVGAIAVIALAGAGFVSFRKKED